MKQVIFKDDVAMAKNALKEMTMMQKCVNRFIMKLLDGFVYKDRLCMVMDFADGGDLQSEINRRIKANETFTESEILTYFT